MNLSMQIGRALFALGLSAAAVAGAFAQTDSDADAPAPAVAHSRLEIAPALDPSVAGGKETQHWVVASVRVGAPVAEPRERARMAARERAPMMPLMPRS